MAIYQAWFNHYLVDRGIRPDAQASRVWAFLGDGECDEPEALGAITLAGREQLDNLIFVVNCNLQRLDGPVRGNGKIVQELEGAFRGAGWNVIKVLWGSNWDPLLERDTDGLLVRRMGEVVDGEYQKYTVMHGGYIREHFFGVDPRLQALVADLSDDQLSKLQRGGHDPLKVYAAYQAAVEHRGSPTVILAKTIKGYGLGEAGEGRNVTHQQKKLNEAELVQFRSRFQIPLSDQQAAHADFYKPPADSPEMQYLEGHRKRLGGFVPGRRAPTIKLKPPKWEDFAEFFAGSEGREVSSTMAFVRLLVRLMRDKNIGRYVVPIVPDEARTFGMEALFRQFGIYSHVGQLYEPVDSDTVLYYREATDGQILEEGITEAGSMASYIAAGTAHSSHGLSMIPFFIYYSMFGFQRIGDLIWAAGDMRCRGFLLGGTAGRTTLAGEGLQHQDGNSHLYAMAYPSLQAYDPAYAYEMAVIILDGIRRMFYEEEDIFYYLTLMNENYEMPILPIGTTDGICRGIYRLAGDQPGPKTPHVRLLGSGAILRESLRAKDILAEKFGVASSVYSVTSYKALCQDARDASAGTVCTPGKNPASPMSARCWPPTPGPSWPPWITSAPWRRRLRPGWGPTTPCWAPTVSAAARPAGNCGGSSRSTPRTSPWLRLRNWPIAASFPRRSSRRRSRPWASTRTSRTRPRPVEGFCERRYTTHDANTIAVGRNMITEFKLPELGENIASGDIVNILVHEGEEITANQGVVELETEKAIVEIPCPHAGKVVKLQVKKGDTVKLGQVVLTLEAEAESAEKPPPVVAESLAATKIQPTATRPHPNPPPEGEGIVPAGPAVRRLARELGVDLGRVHGSGPHGRISAEDVRAVSAPAAAPSACGFAIARSAGQRRLGTGPPRPDVADPPHDRRADGPRRPAPSRT